MSSYPEVVTRIADDYLARVKANLRPVPAREQEEFLREIQSHLYEAYQQTPGPDDVSRILVVLRNFGEPADVVADRLPGSMVRTGTRRSLPLYFAGGILIAVFGLPLGFGGLGVLLGLLAAVAGVLVAYFAAVASVLLVGALCLVLGLIRLFLPNLWAALRAGGVVQINGPPAEFLEHFTGPEQALVILIAGAVLSVAGMTMLWGGKHMFRGLRFLVVLASDRVRRLAEGVRRQLRPRRTQQRAEQSFVGNPAASQAGKSGI